MGKVVIACAPGDAVTGARLLRALKDAGPKNGGKAALLHQHAPSLKADKDLFDAAAPLLLVWSRYAAVDAGLLREAAAAAARGALVLVKLDAVRPPPALRAAPAITLSLARPQNGTAALLAHLAAPKGRAAPPAKGKTRMNPTLDAPGGRDERNTWRGTLLLSVLLTGVAWGAYVAAFGRPPLDILALIAGLRA